MLAYAYKSLRKIYNKDISIESFDKIDDLFAHILIVGMVDLIAKGLNRDYQPHEEFLSMPRGKLDIKETFKKFGRKPSKIFCRYDLFTENNLLNQILKSTINNLLKQKNDLKSDNRKSLRELLDLFEDVDLVSLSLVRWDSLNFPKNNEHYEFLIFLCELLCKRQLISDEDGERKFAKLEDKQRIHVIFEKFLRAYIKTHFPSIDQKPRNIEWDVQGDKAGLPKMTADCILEHDNKTLIIDAKYYHNSMSGKRIENRTLINNHLYQMFAYLKNHQTKAKALCGVLVYAKTDEVSTPNHDVIVCDARLKAKTIDLSVDFKTIAADMDDIVQAWFEGVKRVSYKVLSL
jgi:5-methylcytosine-specific restriction enzyme subunit McrC